MKNINIRQFELGDCQRSATLINHRLLEKAEVALKILQELLESRIILIALLTSPVQGEVI